MYNLLLSIHSLLLTVVPDSTTVAYQLNRFFNTMVTHLEQVGGSIEGNFATEVAQGVAAVAVLFYLGWEMWPVIMGKRRPDIIKLLRPTIIAVIISGWPFFFLMFEGIKTSLADGGKQMYHSQQNSIMAAEKSMQAKIEKIDSIRKKDLITYAFGSETNYEYLREAKYRGVIGSKMDAADIKNVLRENDSLEVYDLNGRCIYRGQEVECPRLSKGMYIFKSGEVTRKVFAR